MANEIFKELKTRIALKQNTYQYWVNGEGKDYIPLYGEVCFCEIPAGSSQATNAPTVLFKVGTAKKDAEGNWVEGTNKTFSQLNWVSALAADVYSWAKKTEADFITWVNTVVQHPAPTVDTNTVYRVVKVSELNYKLQSKSAFDADTAWVDVQGSTITIPEGAKYDLIAKTENSEAILSLAGTDNTEDKVAIVGNDAVSVTVDGGKIKISAHDTKYTGSTGDEIKVVANNDGAITAELTDVVRTKLNKVGANEKAINGLDKRVTAIEKDINDNRDAWLKDDNDNTTYQFSIPTSGADQGKLLVEKKEIGEVAWTRVGAYDFTTPDELTQILSSYYTKAEIDSIVEGLNSKIDGIDTGVMSVSAGNDAIEVGGTTKNPTVGVKLNPTQGNVVLSVNGGLKAQVDLSHNHDSQYKKLQAAVNNPTANGNSLTFIDSITQNAQGVITATKKTVGKVANATHADSADNATHANAADNATHANAADTATHADAATKVDAKLTVKVGKTTIEYDGSEAKTADVDAAINAAIDAIPDAPVYSLKKATDSGAYAAVYNLTRDGEIVGDTINIPKDMVVEEGKVVTNPTGQTPGTYIELKLQNVTNPLYINVSSLIEYVTSGSAASDAIVIAVSKDHKVTATITDGKITLAKLERGVRNAIALAETALQEHQDISGKADKVTGATAGNFAGLDSNGNLVDSGKKAADFVLDADLHQWAKEAQIYHTTTESVTSSAGEVEYFWEVSWSDWYHDLLVELNDDKYLYSKDGTVLLDEPDHHNYLYYYKKAGTLYAKGEVIHTTKQIVDRNKYQILTRAEGQARIQQGGDLVVIEKRYVTATTVSYTGNAVTSVEWDATINNGAGGLKFTKGTQFATKAELDAAIEAFGGDLSAITDNNTKYTFEIPASGEHAGKLVVTEINYANGVAEGSGTAVYCDFVTPEELNTILASYVKDVTAGTGLKVTTSTHSSGKGLTKQIDIDPDVVFVLDCNW